ncbi:hypothetical protein LQW54_002295 [Pestalotiopsis sp. IQ-011]
MADKVQAKSLANDVDVSTPEVVDESGLSSHSDTPEVNEELEKKILRKIDWWLVGFYSLVYIFRVIDSANYSNAAIINLENGTGIKKQLGLDAGQWAWTLSIFSYSYLIFEPPNTLLLKTFRPSRWMFVLILAWGIAACSSAAVRDFKGIMCARFAIGLAEAGFFPAVLYHVDGRGGLSGWRWLFLLEGLPAIILAFVALFWLPDYPETSKLLTEEERDYVQGRLGKSAPSGTKGHWDVATLKVLFKDASFYTFSIFWICHGIGGFGVGYALPTVIYELGFTTTSKSQLMNIPPYVATFLFLNTVGYLLHKKVIRPWTTAVAIESTIIICYIILVTVPNGVVKYLALIVAVSCAGSAYPVIWPERIRAIDGTVAAGIGIGWTNAMAQFGGIVGPHVYNTNFGPTYRVSYVICLCFLVVAITAVCASWFLVRRKDRKRAGQPGV